MKELGIKHGGTCDDECLANLGAKLGVDRVVRQTLSMQDKIQSGGIVWIWAAHQVLTKKRKAFGHYERMCMCSQSVWDFIARQLVNRLINYDPSKVLTLKPSKPARPTSGPVNIPGMVYIPAGEFIMGSVWGEWDEEPRHIVELSDFYMDKYEVTNEKYAQCVKAQKCMRQTAWAKKDLNAPKQPVVGVGWQDGVDYCKFVGKRLPYEAEWEKAARGTDERRYPWGNEWHENWVNMHHDTDGFAATAPIGSYPNNVSPYGVYDMAGNAWEWVWDFHGKHYYKHSERKNPKGPKTGVKHVMRGGSWLYDVPYFVVTSNRSPGRPWIRKKYVGFRCAMDVPK